MSNVSTVTPVESSTSIDAAAVGAVVASAAAALSLLLETDEERAWLDQLKASERAAVGPVRARAAQQTMAKLPVRVHQLHLQHRHVASLVRSAGALGYTATAALPRTAAELQRAPIQLVRADGQRLVISRTGRGRVALLSRATSSSVEPVIQQHVADSAERFLRQRGFHVRREVSPTGELRIRALGTDPRTPAGRAKVDAQVKSGGRARIDIDRCEGGSCGGLRDELTDAMGVRVEAQESHDAFVLPGEPTHKQVRR